MRIGPIPGVPWTWKSLFPMVAKHDVRFLCIYYLTATALGLQPGRRQVRLRLNTFNRAFTILLVLIEAT